MSTKLLYLLNYHFWDKKGSNWTKLQFRMNVNFYFLSDFDGSFSTSFLKQSNIIYPMFWFERGWGLAVKLIIDPVILLCPAHYCVQQNTMSTLTQIVICSPFTCYGCVISVTSVLSVGDEYGCKTLSRAWVFALIYFRVLEYMFEIYTVYIFPTLKF